MTSTLIDVLHDRAHQEPDRVGYRFLLDGEDIEAGITYAELDRQARAIASWLQSSGAIGERVLLIYPSGLDFIAAFWGCLYAGAVAVPAYPPRQNHRLERLQAIASDAQPAFALTSWRLLTRTERWAEQCSEFRELKWMATDQHLSNEEKWQYPAINEGTLAFLQYTSGSTSTPRGVMVSHENILQMEAMIKDAFKTTDRSMVVGWLPLYHDMGLIGNVLHPLFVGAECVLMSPMSFLQSPYRWLRAISKYKAMVSAGPDFAYRLCTRKITPDQRAMLDLSSWQVAINGAEPIQAETINEFCAYFEPCGFRREAFYPCYGLAEATLMVSGVKPAQLQSLPMDAADVSCGQPLAGESVVIADPETLIKCPANQVGEICVAGPNVARGYWRRDEETAHTFHARVSGAANEQTYLRTGDLGYFTNGELVVKGRRKDLIIIRGVNHYPQDIELTVERSHPALQPNSGAAFSVNLGGEEQLIVVQELHSRRPSELDSISAAICRVVAQQHELQVHAVRLIKPGSIPRTSSGKIQRYLCREQFLNETLSVLASWDLPRSGTLETVAPSQFQSVEEIEAWLVSRLARKVGLQSYQIDSTDSALSYGLDSLAAIELTHDIESTLGITMPMAGFLQNNSIVELAIQLFAQLTTSTVSQNAPQLPQKVGTDYPLSYGQRALWFLNELAPKNTAYNIATAARIRSDLDTAALHRAFQSLINRHPSLRTIFTVSRGRVVQRVQERAEVHFVEEDASTLNDSQFKDHLLREVAIPFNLRTGPLLRVTLFKRSPGEYVVSLVVHHIVSDFWSLALMARELGILYHSEKTGRPATLAPLELSYTDYARLQIEMLDSAEGERLWSYWEKQLSGELPVLEFPVQRQPRTVQSYHGATVTFALGAELTERVKSLSQQHAVTTYVILLAALQVLLYRYTGQKRILVGSPTAGRQSAKLRNVVGYFVNPIVLSADFSGAPTFEAFLAEVGQTVLRAFDHQEYPFALLVEQLQLERDPDRSPVFQAMFVLQKALMSDEESLVSFALGEDGVKINLGNLELTSLALQAPDVQFDLKLAVAEKDGNIKASLEYNTDLFNQETAGRLARHYQILLESITTQPDLPVLSLNLLSESEKKQLIEEWNDTYADYSREVCLHQLIENQVERTPDAIAIVYEEQSLTYGELNSRANQLAHQLRKLGVGPEEVVAVLMERSLEMVISLLAILKAGGAYLPLDPTYPAERLAFIVENADARVVLSQRRCEQILLGKEAQVLFVDEAAKAIAGTELPNIDSGVTAENVAYVIYTSGSSGEPKGVMNTHGGICNRLLWMQETYGLTTSDSVLQKTPFTFDVSVWEFFWPLIAGARLVVARPEGHRDPAYLVDLIKAGEITTMHFVPSMLQSFLATPGVENCTSLRRVFSSGEALTRSIEQEFFKRLGCELHNLYGPTEAAVDVSFWECERFGEREQVPIGKPIANTQLYVLNNELGPVPVGVHGEIYIGGAGLARGYLQNASSTAEKFIPDPFSMRAGARLYRAGDEARHLPDGNIEYRGRLDQQVKLRGYRIELGEIESVLQRHEAVAQCVVNVWETQSGDKRLVGYVVWEVAQGITVEDLRRYLSERLPEYMVPGQWVVMDQLPLTSNGKVNRKALPAPQQSDLLSNEYAAPRTATEEILAAIWSELLEVEQVGIHDNFFSLGGHSLLVTQVISRIRAAFSVDVPIQRFFYSPNIADLAIVITEQKAQKKDAAYINQILDNLEQISAADLDRLLQTQIAAAASSD
jgi:amino acid adenylation domain-containing protein